MFFHPFSGDRRVGAGVISGADEKLSERVLGEVMDKPAPGNLAVAAVEEDEKAVLVHGVKVSENVILTHKARLF